MVNADDVQLLKRLLLRQYVEAKESYSRYRETFTKAREAMNGANHQAETFKQALEALGVNPEIEGPLFNEESNADREQDKLAQTAPQNSDQPQSEGEKLNKTRTVLLLITAHGNKGFTAAEVFEFNEKGKMGLSQVDVWGVLSRQVSRKILQKDGKRYLITAKGMEFIEREYMSN